MRAYFGSAENPVLSYEKLAHLYAKLEEDPKATPKKRENVWRDFCGKMGIHREDEKAIATVRRLVTKIQETSWEATTKLSKGVNKSATEDSGVIFLKNTGEETPFAVVKLGYKRAQTEIFARHFAYLLGLSESVVPAFMMVFENPLLSESEETIEELFNGRFDKVFSKGQATTAKVVCVVEPFLTNPEPISHFDYAQLVVCALMLGLRDGKADGIIGKTLFDVEDIMPVALYPDENDTNFERPAATDLPFLTEEPFAQFYSKPLSLEESDALYAIVKKWRTGEIIRFLNESKVRFFDKPSETHLFVKGVESVNETPSAEEEQEASDGASEWSYASDDQAPIMDCSFSLQQDDLSSIEGDAASDCESEEGILESAPFTDDGGIRAFLRETDPHRINGRCGVDCSQKKPKLLSEEQINAYNERAVNLQRYLREEHSSGITIEGMVGAVDPYFSALIDVAKARASQGEDRWARFTPEGQIGRYSPLKGMTREIVNWVRVQVDPKRSPSANSTTSTSARSELADLLRSASH